MIASPVPINELTDASDEALHAAYSREHVVSALQLVLNHPACPRFETLFERAVRWEVQASAKERVSWVNRYVDAGRGVPDSVPWWDVASRQWLLAWARCAPEEVQQHREALSAPLRKLADFCLALVTGLPMPDDVASAIARHFLNAPPGGFGYEELLSPAAVATFAEQALRKQPFPILRRDRVEQLAGGASTELTFGLAVNYCASDFRRVGVELLSKANGGGDGAAEKLGAGIPDVAVLDAALLDEWAARTPNPEGRIVLSLMYARVWGASGQLTMAPWAEEALLFDLRSGSLEDVDVTRESLLALPNDVARHLLAQAVREDRATLLIPALADEHVLHEFLSRVEAGDVARDTAVEALAHCGEEGLSALLSFAGVKKSTSKVSANLATVVAEALGRLLPRSASVEPRTRAAEVLVPWLGHTSKAVANAARRTLESLEDDARSALEAGTQATKKQVRQEAERLLERLTHRQPEVASPLDAVRERALALAERGRAFSQLCQDVYQRSETWSSTVRPVVNEYGAVCLEWLRPWFEEHVPQGDVRLWCYVVDLLAEEPDAVWVATDTFARMPKLPTSLWARPRRALSKLRERLVGPAQHVLTHGQTEYAEPIYGLLAAHAGEDAVDLFLGALASDSKAIRSHAVDALSRSVAAPLDPVLNLLGAVNPGVRISAAELLAVWGRIEARTPLRAALAGETRGPVRAYLEEALAACGATPLWDLPDSEDETVGSVERRLDEALRRRGEGVREPRFLLDSPLPPLKYKSGSPLDEQAALGFLSLVTELDATLKGRLVRQVSAELEQSSVAAWSRHLHARWNRSKDSKFKWAIYQIWVLADESLIDEVGASIGQLRANEHVVLACYLRVLHWRASKRALDWLVHWSNALHSRGARTLAQTLLERVAYRSGKTTRSLRAEADQWVFHRSYEQALVSKPQLERFDADRFAQYLEDCLLTGRSWSWEEWSGLAERFPELFKGLVWRVRYVQAEPGEFQVAIERRGVFQCGSGERIEGDCATEIELAHPAVGAEDHWRKVRQWLGEKGDTAPLKLWERKVYTYGSDDDLTLSSLTTDSQRLDRWIKRKGWFHGEPLDHGLVYSNTKVLGAKGLVFQLNHSGYPIGQHEFAERVELQRVEVFDLDGKELDFTNLSAQVYSELCYQLSQLAATE